MRSGSGGLLGRLLPQQQLTVETMLGRGLVLVPLPHVPASLSVVGSHTQKEDDLNLAASVPRSVLFSTLRSPLCNTVIAPPSCGRCST